MKIVTAAEMREIDRRTTEECGIPSLQLMENAGARFVQALWEERAGMPGRRAVVLCGKGNNGGDGFVIARKLKQERWDVSVILCASGESVRGDAAVNLKRWQEISGEVVTVASERQWEAAAERLSPRTIAVDALLGTGLSGHAEGLLARVIEEVNRRRGEIPIFAVDTPSGLPPDGPLVGGPAIFAHSTITFTAPKIGQVVEANLARVGRLTVRGIGSPRSLVETCSDSRLRWLEPGEFSNLLRDREPASHKGDYGHALIVAGSKGKSGAAVLAGLGALRAGVGLVTVATPENVQPVVASHHPEVMTEALAATDADTVSLRSLEYGRFDALLEGKSVLAMGPGLSTHPETQEFVRTVASRSGLPIILDADALNAFTGRLDALKSRRGASLAITPHPGEMARLLGCTTPHVQQNRMKLAAEAAARANAFVVLKGYRTVIAAPDGQLFINSTGNPGMATGGTGDVLTGMLAGLTAQYGAQAWPLVLCLGVFLHGDAGDRAAREQGEQAMIASDLLEKLGWAFRGARTDGYEED